MAGLVPAIPSLTRDPRDKPGDDARKTVARRTMNLWLRLLWLFATARWRGALQAPLAVSRVPFRVMPHDLDTSLHMNNGRYWTLMDLGRTDLMLRMGLWRAWLKHGWMPVISAGKIRYRRELRLFTPFHLETRVLFWEETYLVIEHRLVSLSRRGDEVANAVALVKAGLYDRKAKGFVPIARLMSEMGASGESPEATDEVRAFLDAEDALKRAR
jgi:acyl-CoA thioesterase FadM